MELEYVTYVRDFFLNKIKPHIINENYPKATSLMRSINSRAVLDERDTSNVLIHHAIPFLVSIQFLYKQLMEDNPNPKIIRDCSREFEINSGQLKMRLEAMAKKY